MQNRLYVTALLTAASLSLFALEVLRFLQIMVDNDNASLKKKQKKQINKTKHAFSINVQSRDRGRC